MSKLILVFEGFNRKAESEFIK